MCPRDKSHNNAKALLMSAYFGRAHVFRFTGKFEMAEQDLDSFVSISGKQSDYLSALIDKANMNFRQGKIELCEKKAREAINIAKKNNDIRTIAEANIPLAQAVRGKGDYKEATNLLEESIEIFTNKLHDSNGLFRAKRIYTHILSSKGQFDKAIETLSELRKNHWASINMLDQSSILTNLATCYSQTGDLDNAIDLYYQAIGMKQKMGDRVGMSICYYSLSYTLYFKCDYDKALDCAQRSLEICEDIKDISGISYAYISIASINKKLGNFGRAIEYHEKSLDVGKPMNDLHMELSNLIDLGFLYSDTGDYANAERVIDMISSMTKNLNNPYYKCSLMKLRISYLDNKEERSEISGIAEAGLALAEQSRMKSDYFHFLSCILEESPVKNEALYNKIIDEAYKSDNMSFRIVTFPALIKYNMAHRNAQDALSLAEEYSELTKSINETAHTAEALYLASLVKKSLKLPFAEERTEALRLSKQLGLAPLIKKLYKL